MSNQQFGTGNTFGGGVTNSFIAGENNTITAGNGNVALNVGNTITSGNSNLVAGLDNTVLNSFQSAAFGANNTVEGFESFVSGTGNKTTNVRAGQNITGYLGNFMYNPALSFAADTFNYSFQLSGGGAVGNLYAGEGISMVDRTIANGVYPLGKHQTYVNTGDGLNYAIMLKGKCGLKVGTFVTFGCKKDDESDDRLIVPAECDDEVIGVITQNSGFIANAGEFPAAERIQYDDFKTPIIVNNVVTNNNLSAHATYHPTLQQNETVQFPGNLDVLKVGINRALAYVPYNQREEYYQVALLGLVVVKACFDKCDKKSLLCSVKDGKAIPGDKYYIVNYIDKHHLLILLK